MDAKQNQSNLHGMVVSPGISETMDQCQVNDVSQSDSCEHSKDGALDGASMQLTSPNTSGSKSSSRPKTWTTVGMELALEELRAQTMGLAQASATYGIPATTLWQRTQRLGIEILKKEGPSKTWNDEAMNKALEAMRSGAISANKAAKMYGIPPSSLYKVARREGISLSAPFCAMPTTWSAETLNRALDAIRDGLSVQKASAQFGIPSSTLYWRCRRQGIELSRTNSAQWSENSMTKALESIQGGMSISHASLNYRVPYKALYTRVKKALVTQNSADSTHTNYSENNTGVVPPSVIDSVSGFNIGTLPSTVTTSVSEISGSNVAIEPPMVTGSVNGSNVFVPPMVINSVSGSNVGIESSMVTSSVSEINGSNVKMEPPIVTGSVRGSNVIFVPPTAIDSVMGSNVVFVPPTVIDGVSGSNVIFVPPTAIDSVMGSNVVFVPPTVIDGVSGSNVIFVPPTVIDSISGNSGSVTASAVANTSSSQLGSEIEPQNENSPGNVGHYYFY